MKSLIIVALLLCPIGMIYSQCVEPNTQIGSTINTFDWRANIYTFYLTGNLINPVGVTSPFFGSNPVQENVTHLWSQDFEPNEGWELVTYDFGTSQLNVNYPYLVLYNRNNALLRILAYVRATPPGGFSFAHLDFKFLNNPTIKNNSSLLEHLRTPMSALDNFSKGNNPVSVNNFYNVPYGSEDGTWLIAEYTMAYDPCTCDHASILRLQPTLKQVSTIDLKTEGVSSPVPIYTQGSGVANAPFTSTFNNAVSFINGASTIYEKGQKTFKNLSGFTSFLNSNVVPSSTTPSSPLANIPAMLPSWFKVIPYVGTAISVMDLLIGGGKSSAPTVSSFDTKYKYETTGESVITAPFFPIYIKTPGAEPDPNYNAYDPIYDNPLGLMNLLVTPKVLTNEKLFEELGQDVKRSGILQSFQLDDATIQYVVNNFAGLSLDPKNIRFQLLFDVSAGFQNTVPGLTFTGKPYEVGTPLMPAECLNDFTIFTQSYHEEGPGYAFYYDNDLFNPKIKVLATLDGNEGAPALYVATYTGKIGASPTTYDNTPANPYLNIPLNINLTLNDYFNNPNIINTGITWGNVIVTGIPENTFLDPSVLGGTTLTNPNLVTSDGRTPQYTETNVSTGTKDFIIQGVPPCRYTQPATSAQLTLMCTTLYDPLSSLNEDEGDSIYFKKQNDKFNELAIGQDFSIYPNPFSNFIIIDSNGGDELYKLEIINLLGIQVLSQHSNSLNKFNLDTSGLPAGVYVLKVIKENKLIYSEKLIRK